MKTFSPRPEHIERRWYVVDAEGAVLGRLATQVATVLRGKHKPIYAPHADTGDHVIVVNAAKVRLSGNKLESKVYYRHSGYPGGLAEIEYERLMRTRPERAVEKAIKGMLPKNRLGRAMGKKLLVYADGRHRQEAQRPEPLALGAMPRWEGLPKPKTKPKPEPGAGGAARDARGTKRAPAKRSAAKRGAGKPAPARKAATKVASARKPTTKRTPAKRTAKKES